MKLRLFGVVRNRRSIGIDRIWLIKAETIREARRQFFNACMHANYSAIYVYDPENPNKILGVVTAADLVKFY